MRFVVSIPAALVTGWTVRSGPCFLEISKAPRGPRPTALEDHDSQLPHP